jgi:magnesium chelatase subunit D
VWHPSRFILVGTMNPEEGELRPQLLDRFGLCVDVRGEEGIGRRVEIMEAEARYRENAGAFARAYGDEQRRLSHGIARACGLVEDASIPGPLTQLISVLCQEAGAVGHRADIVTARTARAVAAYRGAREVTLDDVMTALEFALSHRRREGATRSGQPFDMQELTSQARQQLSQLEAQAAADRAQAGSPQETTPQSAVGSAEGKGEGVAQQGTASPVDAQLPEAEALLELDTFAVRKIKLPRDRRARRTPGKRTTSRSPLKRGRYIRSTHVEKTTDLALDATIRAAAPHQLARRKDQPGPKFLLERQDLRQKVRDRKMGNLIVFVVDASASMDAEQRMVATKGAILSLLRDAYIRRDKVALVVFSGRAARVVLRPTGSTDLAERRLERLMVGGTTPLTHGLMAGLKVIQTERRRDQTIYPLLVLISDGRGNISMWGEEPLVEAQRAAASIRKEQVRALVIDSARDHSALYGKIPGRAPPGAYGAYALNVCQDLAERLGGRYYGLYDLSQQAIVSTVQAEMQD